MVLSLSAKGLTTGEISAHLAEVYGTSVSKDTISAITDRVIAELTDWQSRPLDAVYPVVFIDAIFVKIRDGQVANRPIYVAIGVTVDGDRDILGLWVGQGGEGAKYWADGAHRDQEPWCRRRVHRLLRRAEGSAGLDRRDLAAGDRADVCAAPDPSHVPPRRPPRLGRDRQGPPTGVHRTDRATPPATGSPSSPRRGVPSIRRSSACGSRRGPSSSRSWPTSSRSAGSSSARTPSRA